MPRYSLITDSALLWAPPDTSHGIFILASHNDNAIDAIIKNIALLSWEDWQNYHFIFRPSGEANERRERVMKAADKSWLSY